MEQICSFIDTVPYISDLQKDFYKHYISARMDIILRPVYEMMEQTGQSMSM